MYIKINFAKVADVNDFNPDTLGKRKAYIENQIYKGFSEKLTNFQKDNSFYYWKDLISYNQYIIELIRNIYKKYHENGAIIYQLEQIIGRMELLFENRENSTLDVKSQDYFNFEENLKQLELLSKQLSNHTSKMVRKLAVSLIALGTLITLSSLLFSLFMLSGIFTAGIASVGLVLIGSIIYKFYRKEEEELSSSINCLINTTNNVKFTLDYFDNFVAPKLYPDDILRLREGLILQLNKGLNSTVIRNALEWANNVAYINNGWYEHFFHCIGEICCESATYDFNREQKKCWPDFVENLLFNLNEPTSIKNKLFAFFAKHTCSAVSTLRLLDEITRNKFDHEDQMTLRNSLNHLIEEGASPDLIKKALIWAKTYYENAQISIPACYGSENILFERLAIICGVRMANFSLTPS